MTIQNQVDALVIGATGFIGSAMVSNLLQARKSVRVMVRPSSSDYDSDSTVQVATGTLEDQASVQAAAEGAKVIYNCAGLSADWGAQEEFFSANVIGVRNLLAALEHSGAARLVHLSTSDVYGYPKHAGNEDQVLRDVGLPYNRSKVAGEQEIWQAVETRDLPVTVFRPASVYGPGAKDWVIEIGRLLLKKQMLLLNGGTSPAGLVYVDNLVRAMMTAAETPKARGRAYNIRDVGMQCWKDYVLALAQAFDSGDWGYMNLPSVVALALGWTMESVYGLVHISSRPLLTRHAVYLLSRDQAFSIDRARNELGFESWVSFEEGMARTRAWVRTPTGEAALA
jgi:nucleoside-diphosphate-sugar epimerase